MKSPIFWQCCSRQDQYQPSMTVRNTNISRQLLFSPSLSLLSSLLTLYRCLMFDPKSKVLLCHPQLEDVLNRTSPFSIWINGEKIDVLEQEGQRQSKEFRNLEEKYTEMADGVDSIFTDSMKVL